MTILITPELSNKLFLRKSNSKIETKINQNFRIESPRDFKLIKNIIAIELFTGQRPKIIASFVKKSLVINLRVTKNNWISELPLLQKSPVVWKRYLYNFKLFNNYYYPPMTKANFTISFNKISKLDNWVKSAYLD